MEKQTKNKQNQTKPWKKPQNPLKPKQKKRVNYFALIALKDIPH